MNIDGVNFCECDLFRTFDMLIMSSANGLYSCNSRVTSVDTQ